MSHTSPCSQGLVFLKARFSQELHNFARGDLRLLPLKHACARKLRTLTINYTQLTVKGQVFFQKKINYYQKTVICRCSFERAPFQNKSCKCGFQPHFVNLFFRFFGGFFGITFQFFKAAPNVLVVRVICEKTFPKCYRIVIIAL